MNDWIRLGRIESVSIALPISNPQPLNPLRLACDGRRPSLGHMYWYELATKPRRALSAKPCCSSATVTATQASKQARPPVDRSIDSRPHRSTAGLNQPPIVLCLLPILASQAAARVPLFRSIHLIQPRRTRIIRIRRRRAQQQHPHPKANASPSSSTTAACRTSGRPNWRSWNCGYVSLCVIRSV